MEQNRIRELRKEAGITQEQLSKSLGVNRATLSRYESGEIDPPSSQLQRIADVLHVSVDYLLGYVSDPFFYLDNARIIRELNSYSDDDLIPENRIAAAMAKLNEEGRSKVADYAEDILPRYRRQEATEPPTPASGDTDTPTPPEGTEGPPEGE